MLSVPSIDRVGGVTIYADDTDFFRFYAIADAPRIRQDATGDPVFLLLNYALSDEERAAHPGAPPGGGYLTFDMTFEVTDEQAAAAVAKVQPLVDADWTRLMAGAPEERARAAAAGATAAPKVVLAAPTWTDGAVKMDAPQSARLVETRVAEATPSLLSGNIASFSLDLTPAGADFMEQSLLADAGGADEAPIQVAYDLTFWARLPAARIHLAVDAERMHKYIEEQMRGRPANACTGADYNDTVVDTDALTLSGAVTCQIDTGSGSLPDPVIAELRSYAFDLLKSIVAHSFFSAEGDDGGTTSATTATTRAPRAFPPRPFGRRRLVRTEVETQTMAIRLDLEQRSVVPWTIHPRGTLQTMLPDDLDARKRHVRKLRLNDPFYATLEVSAEVFTTYELIGQVEVELDYAATDENGVAVRQGTTLVFTTFAAQIWRTPVVGGQRAYRWRLRTVLANGRATPFGEWTTETKPRLALAVTAPGVIGVDVIAGEIDWELLVHRVQVHLAYEDAAAAVPREEAIVQLTKDAVSGKYARRLDVPQTGAVMARVRFDLVNGDVYEDDAWQPVAGGQIVVNQPSEALLEVRLLPTGTGWADVVAVLVDLEYDDPANGVRRVDTLTLKSLAEFATWRVFLRDRTRRRYRYRWVASFSDGDLAQQDWAESAGDPVLPVRIDRPGIALVVVADALDFVACPLTEITITHDVPGGASRTLIFRDRSAQTWHVSAAADAPVAFRCAVTHFPAGRDPVVVTPWREADTMIVLPPYRATAAGELRIALIGRLVDFAATPLVAVDLAYHDPANGFEASQSFMLSPDAAEASWVLATRDAHVSGFSRRITYFMADGSQHVGDWADETAPRVVVPAFRAPLP